MTEFAGVSGSSGFSSTTGTINSDLYDAEELPRESFLVSKKEDKIKSLTTLLLRKLFWKFHLIRNKFQQIFQFSAC